jgi:bacillithiol system protein YtxJ
MNWVNLETLNQLDDLNQLSDSKPILFFKHSTRCSISSTALSRLERQAANATGDVVFVYLDLLNYRDISNKLSQLYKLEHESPQALLVKNQKCIVNQSHLEINLADLMNSLI